MNFQDLAAIVERPHAVGAMVIADLYQSAGTVPVDVRALRLDFATGGSVKWLCGGPGAGYLYVRRDLWDQLPTGSFNPNQTNALTYIQQLAFSEDSILPIQCQPTW